MKIYLAGERIFQWFALTEDDLEEDKGMAGIVIPDVLSPDHWSKTREGRFLIRRFKWAISQGLPAQRILRIIECGRAIILSAKMILGGKSQSEILADIRHETAHIYISDLKQSEHWQKIVDITIGATDEPTREIFTILKEEYPRGTDSDLVDEFWAYQIGCDETAGSDLFADKVKRFLANSTLSDLILSIVLKSRQNDSKVNRLVKLAAEIDSYQIMRV